MQKATVLLASITLAAVSCTKPSDAPVVATGDTVRVFTEGDGKWGGPFEAVEVLRVPTDTKETAFGSVRGLVARPDGGVLVYDEKGAEGAILRSFDANGKFEHNIGGEGNGPGEFSGSAIRVVVHRDGTILFYVDRRAIHRFAADGRLLRSFGIVEGGQPDMTPADDGTFYTTVRLQPIAPGSRDSIAVPRQKRMEAQLPQHVPVFHYDTSGRIIDSLMFRGTWLDSQESQWSRFVPSQRWTPLRDGRILVTRTDRLGVVITDPRGVKPPILSEIPTVPVPFNPEERAQQQASEKASSLVIEGGRNIAPNKAETVGEFKLPAPYGWTDTEGRVWLHKTMPSEKVERYCISSRSMGPGDPATCVSYSSYRDPRVYVGFDTDGTFLGEVRFPMLNGSIAFIGDFAWAMTRNDDDEPVLAKYRVRRNP